jgi:hypothetical protein
MGNTTQAKSKTSPETVSADGPGNKEQPTGSTPSKAIEDLRFDLLRSALYHDMRQSGLLRAHRILLFLTILLGSGAIAAFGAEFPLIGQAAGVAVAVLGTASLVWDYGGVSKDHALLRQRFYALLSGLETGADVHTTKSEMTLIFADEPPVIYRVNQRAHNRAGESLFGDDFTKA